MHIEGYEVLSWDTQFFGFSVGVVNAIEQNPKYVQSRLTKIVESPPCRLLYVHVDTEDVRTQDYMIRLGAQIMDNRLVFRREITSGNSSYSCNLSTLTEAYAGCESEELNELAFLAGRFSRFRTDPKFTDADCQRLYAEWIKRSVEGTFADKVLITRDQQNVPACLITLTCKEGIGSIGLLAVRADKQHKGLGKLLVNQALEYFSHKHCKMAEVITQGNNIAACKLYEKSGFAQFQSTYTYHLWFPASSTQNYL